MKIILPTSPPSILILVVIASRHESHVETNLWPSRFGGKVQSWSREMIGSDEFPFNDPFLDPKSREGGGEREEGKGRRAKHNPPRHFPRHRHRAISAPPFVDVSRAVENGVIFTASSYSRRSTPAATPRSGSKVFAVDGEERAKQVARTAFLVSSPFLAAFYVRRPAFKLEEPWLDRWSSLRMRIPFVADTTKVSFRFCSISRRFNFNSSSRLDDSSSKLERNEREDLEMNVEFGFLIFEWCTR